MVAVLEHEHVPAAGVGVRQPQREVVGLRARVDEHAHPQRVGHQLHQPARVLGDRGVQVAGVGVEPRHLPLPRLDHPRVAVADVADVVDEVEERPPAGVEQVGALAADDLQRLVVGEAERAAEAGAPAGGDRVPRARGARGDPLGAAQHEVRVRADALPQVGLARGRDAVHVGPHAHEAGQQLEVHVRRPAAVALGRAEPPDHVAGLQPRALGRQRLRVHVAVEREERLARVGLVRDDRQAAVVERERVVGGVHDRAGERGADRRARRLEQVAAEVDRARLLLPELRCRVDVARLAVAADAEGDPGLRDPLQRILGDVRAGDVERDRGGGGDVLVEHGDRARAAGLEVLADRPCARVGLEPDGVAQAEVGKFGVRAPQRLQRRADPLLADQQVVVLRRERVLLGRHPHAHRQPGADQREQHGELVGTQRGDLVVAAHEREHGAQRVLVPQSRVCARDGEPAHARRPHDVAEVDQADLLAVDEHVVLVGVVVDDLVRERGEVDPVRLGRGRHVPAVRPPHRGMREVRERGVQRRHRAAERAQAPACRLQLRPRRPLDPRQQARASLARHQLGHARRGPPRDAARRPRGPGRPRRDAP